MTIKFLLNNIITKEINSNTLEKSRLPKFVPEIFGITVRIDYNLFHSKLVCKDERVRNQEEIQQ